MEFKVPVQNPTDNCNDTVCDLKVSINYMSPLDKQFILVANSFQETTQNLITCSLHPWGTEKSVSSNVGTGNRGRAGS